MPTPVSKKALQKEEAAIPGSDWVARVKHPDGNDETVKLGQFKTFRPRHIKDFSKNEKYHVSSKKWVKDGKPEVYKVYIGRIASEFLFYFYLPED